MARYVGTLYLTRPDADTYEDPSDAVVEAFDGGRSLINLAVELWRLAKREDRATAIESLLARAYERKPYGLNARGIKELLGLTDGLEEALKENVVDAQLRVRNDQLPELRRRTKLLYLDESRGELAREAVGEGIVGVMSLRNILQKARDEGLHIAFG